MSIPTIHRGIKKAKSEYYTNLIKNSQGNSKEFWKALKQTLSPSKLPTNITSILAEGSLFTSPNDIATALNNFFANIGKKLADRIIPISDNDDSISRVDSIFSIQPISETFVTNAIKQLKPNKAAGLDKIDARLLRDAVDVITPSLTALFNLSIQNKTFPTLWKKAKVVPIYKNDDEQGPSNYRPISILPSLSKVYEKAIYVQFNLYLNEIN